MNRPLIRKDIEASRPIEFDEVLPSTPIMRTTAQELMNRYMHAIYRMTTINPDHLFAGMLKHLNRRLFDPEDLKRRVFLAASLRPADPNIHFHRDLDEPPVHLLVDDRRKWFEEFILLALEKGVVEKRGNRYYKKPEKINYPV